jgi:hypothetical protein
MKLWVDFMTDQRRRAEDNGYVIIDQTRFRSNIPGDHHATTLYRMAKGPIRIWLARKVAAFVANYTNTIGRGPEGALGIFTQPELEEMTNMAQAYADRWNTSDFSKVNP